MKQQILSIAIALLTLLTGLTCAISYRVYSQSQAVVLQAREAALRQQLFYMRKLIDQHAVDRGRLPQSLNELVERGYLHGVPEDPVTGHREWIVVVASDPNSAEGATGIVDIRSASSAISSEGTPYLEW